MEFESFPTEIICEIVANITNIHDILSLLESSTNNIGVRSAVEACVTHVDIMNKDSSPVSYDEYIRIRSILDTLPNIKTYNLHVNFDRNYPEIEAWENLNKIERDLSKKNE